jgi:sarcosine oxidase delta subunit
VDAQARAALRESEDTWLAPFKGKQSLTRDEVGELINWKWQSYPAKRSKSRNGVDADWAHAEGCIRRALAATADGVAVDELRWRKEGIPNWETAMASVILAACRPDRYTVVDTFAHRTLMLLDGASRQQIDRQDWFQRGYWEHHLETCRELTAALGVSLRDLDRAFWVSNGRRTPA